jgi:alpha-tubulin suppressor-like RCC1 family protein
LLDTDPELEPDGGAGAADGGGGRPDATARPDAVLVDGAASVDATVSVEASMADGPVRPSSDVVAIAAGVTSTCAVRGSDHSVWCWGRTPGAGRMVPSPEPVVSPTLFATVTVGDAHACALDLDGKLWCWGDGMFSGTSAAVPHDDPRQVTPDTYVDVSAGPGHTCAVRSDHVVLCWGENDLGQLGDEGTTGDRRLPGPVTDVSVEFARVAVGTSHSCALSVDGNLYCWGEGMSSGIDSVGIVRAPLPQANLFVFEDVTAGLAITCAIESDTRHRMFCIGNGRSSITESNGTRFSPVTAPGGPWLTADLGDTHICAIDDVSELFCWGTSDTGAHARPAGSEPVPARVALPSPVHAVSAGRGHSCAIAGPGFDVFCWGGNGAGQLGLGTVGGAVRMPSAAVVFP